MTNDAAYSYDAVPYVSVPLRYASPEHLYTTATILGMEPTPADSCRVLEIGCSNGGNLLPPALYWPNSRFVGIDSSGVQIEQGQNDVAALSLTNVELRHADLLDIDESIGQFDYIICHRVYSGVPGTVQQKILRVCKDNLKPNGVALVSYNTYPGWYDNQAIREMMRYHVDGIEDPRQQVHQARLLIQWLAETVPDTSLYGRVLRERHQDIQQRHDAYLYHEFLQAVNTPEYFFQFVQKANAIGLSYMGDAETRFMMDPEFLDTAGGNLSGIHDPIRREQYVDFLRHRKFRHSLLCHGEQRLINHLNLERLGDFHVASAPQLVEGDDATDPNQASFKFPNGMLLSTREPVFKEALIELASAWPESVRLSALFGRAAERLALSNRHHQAQILCGRIVNYFFHELIELAAHPGRAAASAGDRPTAFALARYQAGKSDYLSNLKHDCVSASVFGELGRRLIPLLDGSRTRDELAELLTDADRAGSEDLPAELNSVLELLASRFFLTKDSSET